MNENPLLTIRLNGEVVAEATLTIYDNEKAWGAFMDAFQNLAPLIVGEMFNTMRVACHPEMKEALGWQGMVIELHTPGAPQLVVPGNGDVPPNLRGF